MDVAAKVFYEQKFENDFLRLKGEGFQQFFNRVMSAAHPADFIPCRPWGRAGDRKNDGYVASKRQLFQVYAPHEMRMALLVSKIEEDFTQAVPHWREHFDSWILAHNARNGLPPDAISKILSLQKQHPDIKISQWGYEEFLAEFRLLTPGALESLYGPPPRRCAGSGARSKMNLAQALVLEGNKREGLAAMKEALAVARADGDTEAETETLIALALLCSEEEGRSSYFRLAEKKAEELQSAADKMLFLRAKAKALRELNDQKGQEDAYRTALELCKEHDDAKSNVAKQGCFVRAALVHLLCDLGKLEQCRAILAECEEFALKNPDEFDGELLHEALEAGMHFSLVDGDKEGLLYRIGELEKSAASSGHRANRVAGDLINIAPRLSAAGSVEAALEALQACARLARRSALPHSFLSGVLYNEAAILYNNGKGVEALSKAEALLSLCVGPDDAVVRAAANHLISEIRLKTGDTRSAVELARKALDDSDMEESVAFRKFALARALFDDGQTEAAMREGQQAWTLGSKLLPPEKAVEVLHLITDASVQLGFDEVTSNALQALAELRGDSEKIRTYKKNVPLHAESMASIRKRLCDVWNDDALGHKDNPNPPSLQESIKRIVAPLLSWWGDLQGEDEEYFSVAYDAWARGNFARILRLGKFCRGNFNFTVEVRNLAEVKHAVRMWGLYADFLMLLWKGPVATGIKKALLPLSMELSGGARYAIFFGTKYIRERDSREFVFALGHSSLLPNDVVAFLATEAREFIRAGKLLVVPAAAAGCVNPGFGEFEQLLSDRLYAVPGIRTANLATTLIANIPYSLDAPFELLAELAEREAIPLRHLRMLLVSRSRSLVPDAPAVHEKSALALEIREALRDIEARNREVTSRKGFRDAQEKIGGAVARFRTDGRALEPSGLDSPYAPLFVLESLGYGWQVERVGMEAFSPRYQPSNDDAIASWLAPPSERWMMAVRRGESDEIEKDLEMLPIPVPDSNRSDE